MASGTRPLSAPLAVAVMAAAPWATPTVKGNYNRRGASPNSGDGLATQTRMWPTPQAHDGRGAPGRGTRRRGGREADLNVAVAVCWPTPTTSDGTKGSGESATRQGGPSLTTAIAWATPTTRDWRSGRVSEHTYTRNARPLSEQVEYGLDALWEMDDEMEELVSRLNPAWVELLMGFPPGWLPPL